MPNLDNTMWMGNLRMRRQKMERERAEMQAAHQIAAQGASQVQATLEKGFQQGLKAADRAARAAAMRGEPAPKYKNPRMQAHADSGYTEQMYVHDMKRSEAASRQQQKAIENYLDMFKFFSDQNYKRDGMKQRADIAELDRKSREGIAKNRNQTRISLANKSMAQQRKLHEDRKAEVNRYDEFKRRGTFLRTQAAFKNYRGEPQPYAEMVQDPQKAKWAEQIRQMGELIGVDVTTPAGVTAAQNALQVQQGPPPLQNPGDPVSGAMDDDDDDAISLDSLNQGRGL